MRNVMWLGLIRLQIVGFLLVASTSVVAQTQTAPVQPKRDAATTTTRTATTARSALNAFTLKLQTLSGTFEQFLYRSDGNLAEKSIGLVALKAPNLLRWEYQKPYVQKIVADGNNIWVYDEDLAQVTVRRQVDEEMNSPLAVLIDPAQLDRNYLVAEDGLREKLRWLKLTPKSKDAVFKTALIGMNGNTPQRIVVIDGLKQKTEWRFTAWKRNVALANASFKFTPPKGVDVVGEAVESADVVPLRD